MKKKLALWVILAGCMMSVTACENKTDMGEKKEEVEEITFQKGNTSAGKNEAGKGKKNSLSNASPTPGQSEDKNTATDKKGRNAYEKITVKGKIQSFGGTIQIGDAGYELYNYVESSGKKYTSIVNRVAAGLKGKADVYDIIVPTSVGITLPDNKSQKVNSSNQEKAIKEMYRSLNKNVRSVSLYETLMQHRTEYIYFRTDHHWTSRGAYYAYQQFCQKKGIEAHELEEYKTKSFGGYLGTFYTDTNASKTLRQDEVRAYYPVDHKQIKMTYRDENGGKYQSPVICDGSNYGTQLKYCAFIAGDNPFSIVQNKRIKDGSSCVVVKESYGNAFVPYLADHYQKIYVIDYRYWKGSVQDFAKKNKVQDVIFMNNISMTRNAYLIGKLAQVQ